MPRCAFLTMTDPGSYVIDDELAHEPLRSRGWVVEAVPWDRGGVAWEAYDLVVIRSTWDYPERPLEFLDVLEEIGRRTARLENDLKLVRWNLRKSYLLDLASRGVPVVPTLRRDALDQGDLQQALDELDADDGVVVKPLVGASAGGAFRVDDGNIRGCEREIEEYFSARPLLIQPLVRAVIDEGEFSLFYFNGRYSHAVLKTPKPGDFRVQEEHGGLIRSVEPATQLEDAARAALDSLDEVPLYARVDLVRGPGSDHGGDYWLMELELIEPSLYLRMDPGAPRRFADAICERGTERGTDL